MAPGMARDATHADDHVDDHADDQRRG